MNKSSKKTPKAILEAAFNNYIKGKVASCFGFLSEISESELVGLDKSLFQKTLILLLVGEFFGCHTLHQILSVEMVKSGTWHSRLASLTYKQIESSVCSILKEEGLNAFTELAKKSESSWSRAAVSLVIDDSIFKQWLTHGKIDPATSEYFDRYFSLIPTLLNGEQFIKKGVLCIKKYQL